MINKILKNYHRLCLFMLFGSVVMPVASSWANISHNKNDHYVGVHPDKAKVVMIEYGSLTCVHCDAFFNNYVPKLVQKYANNGKSLSIVYRIFVADGPSLMAMMALYCKPLTNDKYKKIISSLYKTNLDWAFVQNFQQKLEDFFLLHGYTREEFRKCIACLLYTSPSPRDH
jgi:protein-disulfide isomerase